MMKLTFSLAVALYAGFVIWGQPEQMASATADTATAPIAVASAADFDRPTILTDADTDAQVTRAIARDVIVPDAAIIAASAPAPAADFERGRDIGEPMIVSLVDPGAAPAPAANTGRDGLLVVTGSRVNLRAGPSTGNAVVDSLAEGTVTEPLGAPVDGWQEIRDVQTGLTGFMAARFLTPS